MPPLRFAELCLEGDEVMDEYGKQVGMDEWCNRIKVMKQDFSSIGCEFS